MTVTTISKVGHSYYKRKFNYDIFFKEDSGKSETEGMVFLEVYGSDGSSDQRSDK